MQALLAISLSFWLAQSADDYIQFPCKYSDQKSWWTVGDATETTVIFSVVNSLFVTSAVVFSLGGHFRRAVWHNLILCVSWLVLMGTTSYLLLSDSNKFTRLFHMVNTRSNCH